MNIFVVLLLLEQSSMTKLHDEVFELTESDVVTEVSATLEKLDQLGEAHLKMAFAEEGGLATIPSETTLMDRHQILVKRLLRDLEGKNEELQLARIELHSLTSMQTELFEANRQIRIDGYIIWFASACCFGSLIWVFISLGWIRLLKEQLEERQPGNRQKVFLLPPHMD